MIAALLATCLAGLSGYEMPLDDPRKEMRATDLMAEIRCVACENEPISQSAADIATDMRKLVRCMVDEGDSDADVRGYFAERYGDFVLLRPPADGPARWLLWIGPFILIVVIGAGLMLVRRGAPADIEPVDPDET